MALDNCAKIILKGHLEHCILHAVRNGRDAEALSDLEIAIDRYLR